MFCRNVIRVLTLLLFLLGIVLSFSTRGLGGERIEPGTLKLTIVDEQGNPTPARVEVLNSEGKGYVAEDALLVGGDPKDRDVPWKGTVEDALAALDREVKNDHTGTVQFYSTGTSRLSLPPGRYSVKLIKGPEYGVESREVEVGPARDSELKIRMCRWIDMKAKGWYSADGHLHIARPHRELDPFILRWMEAEDLRVSNLLQWGNVGGFNNTIQHSFGPGSVHRKGDYLVASGQESPRTHALGHTVVLGASTPIDLRDRYVIYKVLWEEARRQGALKGYVHGGLFAGAMNGLSVDLPLKLLDFLEVLQFDGGHYDVWYNILNTGFTMTPTAGSDYPFGSSTSSPSLPGRERFYTRLDGPFTYETWLEGVRQGRTFVTNGPLLGFTVNGKGIGEELVLEKPDLVRVEGSVWFDPARDDVDRLEVIANGQILRTFLRKENEPEIHCRFYFEVREAGWLALRASGNKVAQVKSTPSTAHSGAIYLTVRNMPGRSKHPRAKALARAWVARLRELEARVESQPNFMGLSRWIDQVSGDYIRKNQQALLEAIRSARKYFMKQAR